jgi:phosphomannomutase
VHLGVDPDVDRLAFICEDGEMFGEYTLVACADYVLSKTPVILFLCHRHVL